MTHCLMPTSTLPGTLNWDEFQSHMKNPAVKADVFGERFPWAGVWGMGINFLLPRLTGALSELFVGGREGQAARIFLF